MAIVVDKEEKKREIALSSIDVFIEKGLQRATVEEIAKNAGVAKGTVYNYFSSKEEIVVTIWDYFETVRAEYVDNEVKNINSTKEKFKVYFQFYKFIDEKLLDKLFFLYREYLGAILLNHSETLFEDFKKHYEFEFKYIKTFFTEGVESGELKDINIEYSTKSFISMTKGLIIDSKYYNSNALEALDDLYRSIDNFFKLIEKEN